MCASVVPYDLSVDVGTAASAAQGTLSSHVRSKRNCFLVSIDNDSPRKDRIESTIGGSGRFTKRLLQEERTMLAIRLRCERLNNDSKGNLQLIEDVVSRRRGVHRAAHKPRRAIRGVVDLRMSVQLGCARRE